MCSSSIIARLAVSSFIPMPAPRPVEVSSGDYLARAVALHLAGKREEALQHLERAVAAGDWLAAIQNADGGWGGIQPPWVYGLMALHTEGFANDHPVMAKGLAGLNDPGWRIDDGDATFIQATNSPVWDTILMLMAVKEAGALDKTQAEIDKAVEWLLART